MTATHHYDAMTNILQNTVQGVPKPAGGGERKSQKEAVIEMTGEQASLQQTAMGKAEGP